ncbi:hypothetical protein [Piscinibacter sp. XHJ-5]|uniref:ATP-binding protein n=1 Tax=Piscinibacter sp. XHJ-5 TaxID=3037797 RepID=UPI0024535880|nr:hypothetical protein [Piscinibacter sp. XHJ-5]
MSLAVAEACSGRYADGVYFIDLAPVAHDRLVPNAMAFGFGLSPPEDDIVACLSSALRNKKVLAVLDNCEHVVDAVVPLVEQLLKLSPGLHVLATSREPLRAEGEWLHRLPALGMPAADERITACQALAYPAVQLFVDRALSAVDGFELSDEDAPLVGQLCHRLDGNPLAIELAAARVDLFGVRGLARQLDAHVLQLKGQRSVVARHKSLGVMLDWSYELLTDQERSILRQLSIFKGRFTLDAALELVRTVGADESLTPDRVFDCIMDLADKSLAISDAGGDTVCFRLLELARTYALERLVSTGEHAIVAARHAELVLALMRRASLAWPAAATKRQWLAEYGWAVEDIRSALAWAFSQQGSPYIGSSLVATVWPLAMQMNPFEDSEAIERALKAVATLPDTPPELEISLHIGSAAFRLLRRGRAGEALSVALQLAEQSGEARLEADVLMGLTVDALASGSYERATANAERLQSAARRSREPLTMLVADRFAAQACHFAGDHGRARALAERVLSHPMPRGWLGPAGMIDHSVSMRIVLSRSLWLEGLADEAAIMVEQALDHAMADSPSALCQALSLAACPVALWRGDTPAAERWITRLEEEYSNHAMKGGWSPAAAGMPWRRVLEAQAQPLESRRREVIAEEAANTLQLDHLISAHAAFVTRDAATRAGNGGGGWCAPEILRARGEMILRGRSSGASVAAESLFQRARAMARQQGALAWELRAVTSLAALWRDLGRGSESLAALEPVVARFTEGFTTADLRAAAALLETLRTA